MATAHGILSVTLEDTEGVKVPVGIPIQVADTTTLATVISDAQAMFALMDPATDAAGVVAHFSLDITTTGLKSSATVENPVSHGGLFTFSQTGSKYAYSSLLPSVALAEIAGGTLDLSEDSNIDKYLDWFTAPPGALKAESEAHNLLSGFLRGRVTTRKHRKAQSRLTTQKGVF